MAHPPPSFPPAFTTLPPERSLPAAPLGTLAHGNTASGSADTYTPVTRTLETTTETTTTTTITAQIPSSLAPPRTAVVPTAIAGVELTPIATAFGAPLDVVEERTEPTSSEGNATPLPQLSTSGADQQAAPAASSHARSGSSFADISSQSASAIARQFPLPPTPVKGPRSQDSTITAAGSGVASTPRASDLIRMFENRGGVVGLGIEGLPKPRESSVDPLPAQPHFAAPTKPTRTQSSVSPSFGPAGTTTRRFHDLLTPPTTIDSPAQATLPTPPTSFKPYIPSFTHFPPTPSTHPSPPTPPKPASPLSTVRTLVASWRARSGSPNQRVVGSPNTGDSQRFLGRADKSWNVSIRRRRRDEGKEGITLHLAEQEDEVQQQKDSDNGGEIKRDTSRVEAVGYVKDIGARVSSVLEKTALDRPNSPTPSGAQQPFQAAVLTGEVSTL
jgi:hypothetical protein